MVSVFGFKIKMFLFDFRLGEAAWCNRLNHKSNSFMLDPPVPKPIGDEHSQSWSWPTCHDRQETKSLFKKPSKRSPSVAASSSDSINSFRMSSSRRSARLNLRCTINTLFIGLLAFVLVMPVPVNGLRCYVCGGSTGRECEDIVTRRWSPYVRPRPVLTSDGKRQWEECTDLINNKGCIKQVVNGGKFDERFFFSCFSIF